ncbi:MAG: hypothetical protein NVS2B12_08760 [Ktedonobacteraceae bacterium]
MDKRITVDQLEMMKTHELADLLANVVLILKRMPNVECRQLAVQFSAENPSFERDFSTPPAAPALPHSQLALREAELRSKKMADLKAIAHDLGVVIPSKLKKDEIVTRIVAHLSQSHSEQYAIQNL